MSAISKLKELARRIEGDLMQFEFDAERLGIKATDESIEKFDKVVEILKKAEALEEND